MKKNSRITPTKSADEHLFASSRYAELQAKSACEKYKSYILKRAPAADDLQSLVRHIKKAADGLKKSKDFLKRSAQIPMVLISEKNSQGRALQRFDGSLLEFIPTALQSVAMILESNLQAAGVGRRPLLFEASCLYELRRIYRAHGKRILKKLQWEWIYEQYWKNVQQNTHGEPGSINRTGERWAEETLRSAMKSPKHLILNKVAGLTFFPQQDQAAALSTQSDIEAEMRNFNLFFSNLYLQQGMPFKKFSRITIDGRELVKEEEYTVRDGKRIIIKRLKEKPSNENLDDGKTIEETVDPIEERITPKIGHGRGK